jgi:hypothetical protein
MLLTDYRPMFQVQHFCELQVQDKLHHISEIAPKKSVVLCDLSSGIMKAPQKELSRT